MITEGNQSEKRFRGTSVLRVPIVNYAVEEMMHSLKLWRLLRMSQESNKVFRLLTLVRIVQPSFEQLEVQSPWMYYSRGLTYDSIRSNPISRNMANIWTLGSIDTQTEWMQSSAFVERDVLVGQSSESLLDLRHLYESSLTKMDSKQVNLSEKTKRIHEGLLRAWPNLSKSSGNYKLAERADIRRSLQRVLIYFNIFLQNQFFQYDYLAMFPKKGSFELPQFNFFIRHVKNEYLHSYQDADATIRDNFLTDSRIYFEKFEKSRDKFEAYQSRVTEFVQKMHEREVER